MSINGVSDVVNNYYLNSLLKTMNDSTDYSDVPLVSSIDDYAKNNSNTLKYEGVSPQTELKNVLNAMDANNALLIKNSEKPSVNFQDLQRNNDLNLLNNLNNNSINVDNNVLSVYTSLENGTFRPSVTSISTSNPFTLYSNVNAMMSQLQTSGNFLSAVV
jgi:hypothetical protein